MAAQILEQEQVEAFAEKALDDLSGSISPATGYVEHADGHCMTTSIAHGDARPGTCGMPEAKARELCLEAGLPTLTRLPVDDPFNALYEVRP